MMLSSHSLGVGFAGSGWHWRIGEDKKFLNEARVPE